MKKRALITGITGQDGAYLTHLLLSKGYEVHGMKRRCSCPNTFRIDDIILKEDEMPTGNFHLHYADLTDTSSIVNLVNIVQPDEIYNLAAQSHVKVSFETPEYTAEADAVGTLRLLEAIRVNHLINKTRYYQASTSELFGLVQEVPQKETTPFYPRSPYAVAKMYAHWITVNYREAHNLFACCGILFNHESPMRGENFVTRKITRGVAAIKEGLMSKLKLGNLNSLRDWGHAKDYVEAMYLMLQQDSPDDYVIATGKQYSVKYFTELAFKAIGVEIVWEGSGVHEIGKDSATGKTVVEVDPKFFRPAEVDTLLGDSTKAREKLGWEPKISIEQLAAEMVEIDLKSAQAKKYELELKEDLCLQY